VLLAADLHVGSERISLLMDDDEPIVQCPLCGFDAPAVAAGTVTVRGAFPAYDGDVVPNARTFQSGGYVLLHHECSSRQANTDTPWWDPLRAWWACKQPARPIDGDAHFDLNCMECARRWATSVAGS
jgi:hypothetical protein